MWQNYSTESYLSNLYENFFVFHFSFKFLQFGRNSILRRDQNFSFQTITFHVLMAMDLTIVIVGALIHAVIAIMTGHSAKTKLLLLLFADE